MSHSIECSTITSSSSKYTEKLNRINTLREKMRFPIQDLYTFSKEIVVGKLCFLSLLLI